MATQAVTLADIEQMARDMSQDNDATTGNYAITSTVVKRQINRLYAQLKQGADSRVTEVASATSGLSSITTAFKNTTLATIRRVLAAYIESNGAATGEPLERCKPWEIDEWASDYSTTGTIKRYSTVKVNSNATPPTPNFWRFHFHPTPTSSTAIFLRAELETVLLSNSTDVPELTDGEIFLVASLTAAWMAERIGRDWLVPQIMSEVPADMQAQAELLRKWQKPMRHADEEAA